jgi:hypothetical protein
MEPKSASSGTKTVWSKKKSTVTGGEQAYQIHIPFV